MTNPIKTGHIALIFLTLAFVFFLFILSSFVSSPVSNKTFKSQALDESSLETAIFSKINSKRLEHGNHALQWDERIYEVAKAHNLDLQTQGIFSHQNLEGEDVTDRLRNEDLFFLMAAENICGLPSGTENIPDAVVEGWMKSPSHRWVIVDRDRIFTHGAVGVDCSESSCFVTFDCADFVVIREVALQRNYYTHINLNDESLGFQESYPVEIDIKSSNPVDVYFFDTFTELKDFTKTGSDSSSDKVMRTTAFSDQREARKDSYILIRNNYDSATDVTYELVYN
jgi:uncharacterized protein YkwD